MFGKNRRNQKKSAFSVAEAMITLLIVSLALSAAAPIFTKRTRTISSGLTVADVQNMINDEMARSFGNSVVYFDGDSCPNGWTQVTTTTGGIDLRGRFVRVAGPFTPNAASQECHYENAETANPSYVCTNVAPTPVENGPLTTYGDAIRNIQGSMGVVQHAHAPFDVSGGVFPSSKRDQQVYGSINFNVAETNITTTLRGEINGEAFYNNDFDASRVVPTAQENRPYSIALIACRYGRI